MNQLMRHNRAEAELNAYLAAPEGQTPTVTVDLNLLRDQCGEAAKQNGRHDRFLDLERGDDGAALTDHLVTKTALIGCEVAEAIEELRDGHAPHDTYEGKNGKPEGYPTELADIIIRALDLAYMLNIDINAIVQEKLRFNATRGVMHGGKTI